MSNSLRDITYILTYEVKGSKILSVQENQSERIGVETPGTRRRRLASLSLSVAARRSMS